MLAGHLTGVTIVEKKMAMQELLNVLYGELSD